MFLFEELHRDTFVQAPPFAASLAHGGVSTVDIACGDGFGVASRQAPPFMAAPIMVGFPQWLSPTAIASASCRGRLHHSWLRQSWWGFHGGYRLRRFTQKPHHSRLRSLMVGFPQWLSPSAIYLRLPFYKGLLYFSTLATRTVPSVRVVTTMFRPANGSLLIWPAALM